MGLVYAHLFVREWTLAKRGHHPFADGRSSRHASHVMQLCLCGDGEQSYMLHDIAPSLRIEQIWMRSIPLVDRQFVHSLSDEEYFRLLFTPVSLRRTPAAIFPHITFVSKVCQAQRSRGSGLEPHAPLYGNAVCC